MFGLAWPEVLLIGAVAVIAIGPKDLPPLMRQIGKWTRQARRMLDEFKGHMEDLPAQADLASMQKQADAIQKSTYEQFDVKPDPGDTRKQQAYGDMQPITSKSERNTVEAMSSDDGLVNKDE